VCWSTRMVNPCVLQLPRSVVIGVSGTSGYLA